MMPVILLLIGISGRNVSDAVRQRSVLRSFIKTTQFHHVVYQTDHRHRSGSFLLQLLDVKLQVVHHPFVMFKAVVTVGTSTENRDVGAGIATHCLVQVTKFGFRPINGLSQRCRLPSQVDEHQHKFFVTFLQQILR